MTILPKTPLWDELQRLQSAADEFESLHADGLHAETKAYSTAKIHAELPELESLGLTVWCRNGAVCSDATPCRQLFCEYKSSPEDVTNGCASCRCFVVCEGATDWCTARQKFTSSLEPFSMNA